VLTARFGRNKGRGGCHLNTAFQIEIFRTARILTTPNNELDIFLYSIGATTCNVPGSDCVSGISAKTSDAKRNQNPPSFTKRASAYLERACGFAFAGCKNVVINLDGRTRATLDPGDPIVFMIHRRICKCVKLTKEVCLSALIQFNLFKLLARSLRRQRRV
jgi:hypothetical protein